MLEDLKPAHFLLLATLLRRYLRASTPWVEGRGLLSAVFDSSYELLEGLQLLQPEGLLRTNGLVVAENDEDASGEGDLLEVRFRLADSVVNAFSSELGLRAASVSSGVEGQAAERAYEDQEEFLVDLKLLHNLYRARAKRSFCPESWWRLRSGTGDRAQEALERRIRETRRRIDRRLARTPEASGFPMRRFVADFGLTAEEELVVLHLLFLELLEGNPYADVVALVQLVSGSEHEFLQNRRLFAAGSSLRRNDIIELEQMIEGRELTSECHLATWVMERLLGPSQRGPIDADERLNFHLYLKRLGSSNFLRDE